jgi:hypothetical protein
MILAVTASTAGVAHAGAEPHLKSGVVGIARLQTSLPDSDEVPPGPCRDVPPGPCRSVVVTLDVFDNVTGRSSILLDHASFVDVDPTPAAAPAGQ